jgi:hypothetical protein
VGYHLAFGCMACASIKHATHGCQPFTVEDSPTDAVGCIGLKVVVCMANHHTGEPSKGSHKMHFRFIWYVHSYLLIIYLFIYFLSRSTLN